MPTPKTWTATDIKQNRLAITQVGPTLHVERRYQFVDAQQVVLDDVAGGRLVAEVEWSAIPPAIQQALLAIDDWTYAQILAQEGMQEEA